MLVCVCDCVCPHLSSYVCRCDTRVRKPHCLSNFLLSLCFVIRLFRNFLPQKSQHLTFLQRWTLAADNLKQCAHSCPPLRKGAFWFLVTATRGGQAAEVRRSDLVPGHIKINGRLGQRGLILDTKHRGNARPSCKNRIYYDGCCQGKREHHCSWLTSHFLISTGISDCAQYVSRCFRDKQILQRVKAGETHADVERKLLACRFA